MPATPPLKMHFLLSFSGKNKTTVINAVDNNIIIAPIISSYRAFFQQDLQQYSRAHASTPSSRWITLNFTVTSRGCQLD
jgi:hypothetical protein